MARKASTSKYASLHNPNATPQTEAIPGREAEMAPNNAGGVGFKLDAMARLKRWLILGSDSATYYQSAKKLTAENAAVVVECWARNPAATAQLIGDISWEGRAPRQDPAFFALALGVTHPSVEARRAAYAAVGRTCRTASHLFSFLRDARALGKGFGRGMKRVIADWYAARSTDEVAFQAIKYRDRAGYNHKRALELGGRGAGEDLLRQGLYRWVRGKELGELPLPTLVKAHLEAMRATDRKKVLKLITEHRLPWEAIPTAHLGSPDVWKALVPHLGLTALIRNLGNMTANGAITPMDHAHVTGRLREEVALRRARVHPFTVLQALAVYKAGKGIKGAKTWTPVPAVIDALNDAFYLAFGNVEPTGKRIFIGLDVSGSMGSSMMGSPLTCREASAALALVTAATEQTVQIAGFTSGRSFRAGMGLTMLDISARQRLDDVVKRISGLMFGATDCSLPMEYALEKNIPVDAFVIYTDNETYAGRRQPSQALAAYRKEMGIPAKLIVVGMTATGISIADPQDGGMLDVVGFDSNCPALISDFIR